MGMTLNASLTKISADRYPTMKTASYIWCRDETTRRSKCATWDFSQARGLIRKTLIFEIMLDWVDVLASKLSQVYVFKRLMHFEKLPKLTSWFGLFVNED